MSNYYVGTAYAPLPSSSSIYSSWAYVSYSVDPTDASGVSSIHGHLVKNTIQALSDYARYIEYRNLRSGWGGLYTWRSGQMNVNEGPTQDNCAFYVKYGGQWINLRDNTAVEQAGLDSIFELQAASDTGQSYYVLVRTWEDDDEDKYQFGYTVSIKQNSTLEGFYDSTNEAAIIQFLADINYEGTGAYVSADTTLGAESPLLILLGEIYDVDEVWETGTGRLVPSSWTHPDYVDTSTQDTKFPSVKRTLTHTPWLSQSLVAKRIDPYFKDSANTGQVYALRKGCLIGSAEYDARLYGANDSTDKKSAFVYRDFYGTYHIKTERSSIQDILSTLGNNPALYDDYRFHGDNAFVMLDVIAGGGGGGQAFVKPNTAGEFASGGGGGAGGSCRLAVRLIEGSLLLIEAGAAGQAKQDGWESRVCLLDSNNAVISGVVCDGGHAGFNATENNYGGGGNGGAVYWCAGDGYSMGQNITHENNSSDGPNIVVWDSSVDQFSQVGLVDNASCINVIFAATGGWGGHGGDRRAFGAAEAQKGWQPQYNGSSFTQFSMIANDSTQVFFRSQSIGSSGDPYLKSAGGGGGFAINKWESSAGGSGGQRGDASAISAGKGINGGGGGGGAARGDEVGAVGRGGAGVIYVCR